MAIVHIKLKAIWKISNTQQKWTTAPKNIVTVKVDPNLQHGGFCLRLSAHGKGTEQIHFFHLEISEFKSEFTLKFQF